MIAAFDKGDVETRPEINARLLESLRLRDQRRRAQPVPAKAMLRALGLPVGQCRLADGPAPDGLEDAGPRGARRARAAASGRTRSASPSSAGSARSAATAPCIEVDGRIMLLDCGLMFPDPDMLGIDLVLPDFTYLRENADRIDGLHRHPRPRGPRRRPVVPPARAVVPDLRLGAHARPGPQPHRGGRAARPHRAHPAWPTASGADRPLRRASSSPSPTRCPTGSPPPSTRRRA